MIDQKLRCLQRTKYLFSFNPINTPSIPICLNELQMRCSVQICQERDDSPCSCAVAGVAAVLCCGVTQSQPRPALLHTSQHSLPTPQSLVVNSGYSVSLNNIRALMLHGLPLPSSTGCISNYSSSADHCAGVWGGSGPECSWSSTDSRLQHSTSSSRAKRYCGCTVYSCTVYTVQYSPRLLRCTAP